MKPSFDINDLAFFKINPNEATTIIENLGLTCGAHEIPKTIWEKQLSALPSPLQASDCIAVYISGPIPTATASIGDTTLDIIRKESKRKKNEPEYNCYYQYIIKNSDGSLYISGTIEPDDDHWAVVGTMIEKYGVKFLKE